MELTLAIYRIVKNFPTEEKFGLISQMQRASTSIMANIAEGFERYHTKDKIRFYYLSRGSLAEVQCFLMICSRLHYVSDEISNELLAQTERIAQLINGLIRSLSNNDRVPSDESLVPLTP